MRVSTCMIQGRLSGGQPTPPPPGDPKPPEDDDGTSLKELWQTLTSGELLQAGLKLSPARLTEAIEASKDLGKAVGNSWRDIKDAFRKVLHLPVVEQHFDPEKARHISEITVKVVSGLGYAAGGVQAVAGLYKLRTGLVEKNKLKQLDGCLDLAMAGAIGTTIASAGIAPMILVPLAATLGLVRGGVHAVAGYRKGNARNEVQGMLDGTRSVAILGSMLGHASPMLATAGAILGPVAGVIQSCRGFIDLRDGLRAKAPAKQLQGLTDIGSALGLMLASTGIGTIPGVILTAVSVGARVLYPLNKKFARRCDKVLARMEPVLQKGVKGVETVWNPVLHTVRPVIDKILGREPGPPSDP